ncbi:cytidine deaminase [Lactobacillus kimbladii]|nr:cytidine deaminase [Lactobacillus kimbladii]
MEAGGVAAAVLAESGKIYTGVCVDTACGLGVCAERNALFNMITNGETKISRILALMADGKNGAPCGACREFIVQLMEKDYQHVEVMLDYESGKVATMGELTPEWWL